MQNPRGDKLPRRGGVGPALMSYGARTGMERGRATIGAADDSGRLSNLQ